MAIATFGAAAQEKKTFTVLKANPITSIKNQSRSGTCWDFATLAFFEGEILRQTGRTYYKGTWYMSRNYIALNTIYIFLNRHAVKSH